MTTTKKTTPAAKSSASDAPKKAAAKKSSASEEKTAKAAKPATEKLEAKTPKTSKAKAEPKPEKKPAAKAAAPKAAVKKAEKAAPAPAKEKPAAKPVASKAKKVEAEGDKLPHSFNPEYLVLMQKDPNWMHAFWEVSEERIKAASKGKGKVVLRLFDVSGDLTVRRNKQKRFRDVEVPADARSWYVESPATKAVSAVLGTVSGTKFTPIVEASPVLTFDKNAAAPGDSDFVKASLGGATLGNFMSSGFSSQTAASWLESLNLGSSSESLSSGALSSGILANENAEIVASPESVNYGKDFFLWVKTRLIVYGGTRPDAHLQVRGEPFPLNPDGTFSFEQDLPDSTQVIPVFATDKDGDFPTTIVPIVVKRTE